MTPARRRLVSAVTSVALAAVIAGCAPKAPPPITPGAPHFPDYPTPEVPATLRISPETRRAHDDAWARRAYRNVEEQRPCE